MAKITLSNQKSFSAEHGDTILESALSLGLILDYSCRTGRCGACKARVISGSTSIQKEEEALSDLELRDGYILTCCRSALNDTSLDIEDLSELAKVDIKTLPCRINSISKVTKDVVSVTLRTPPGNKLEFVSGQYIDVIGPSGIRRSYSLANSSRRDGLLELLIRKVPDGVMSQYWFDEAKPNDLLRLEGPLGTFYLRDKPEKRIVFLATGTGIAPIKAILETMQKNAKLYQHRYIYLYWGCRAEADIYWTPKTDELPITFIPVLSRPGANWNGKIGYIQDAFLDDFPELGDSVVYACGSESMISSSKPRLTAAGLPSQNFFSDAFVSSS